MSAGTPYLGTLYHVKQNEYDMEKKKEEIIKEISKKRGFHSTWDIETTMEAMQAYADQFRPSVKASEAAEEEAKRRYPNSSIKVADMIVHYEEWEQLAFIAGTQWKEGQRADLIETAFKEGYARRNSQHYSRDWAEFKEKYLTGKEADQDESIDLIVVADPPKEHGKYWCLVKPHPFPYCHMLVRLVYGIGDDGKVGFLQENDDFIVTHWIKETVWINDNQ